MTKTMIISVFSVAILLHAVLVIEGSIYNTTEKLGNMTITVFYDEPIEILKEKSKYPECYYDEKGYPLKDKKVEKCLFKKLDKEEQEYQKMIKEIDEDEKEK